MRSFVAMRPTAPCANSRRRAASGRNCRPTPACPRKKRCGSCAPRKVAEARAPLDRFLHAMELTSAYQASLDDVKWLEGPLTGRPVLSFTPKSIAMLRGLGGGSRHCRDPISFASSTSRRKRSFPRYDRQRPPPETSRAPSPSAISTATARTTCSSPFGRRNSRRWTPGCIAFAAESSPTRPRNRASSCRLARRSPPSPTSTTTATSICSPSAAISARTFFATTARDGFRTLRRVRHLASSAAREKPLFVDLDHDGDLDLLLVGGPSTALLSQQSRRNVHRDGATVGPRSRRRADTRDAAFADFDDDGRIDLLVANERGRGALYHNAGESPASPTPSASSGLNVHGASAIAVGDYNNDGFIDVFVAGREWSRVQRSG